MGRVLLWAVVALAALMLLGSLFTALLGVLVKFAVYLVLAVVTAIGLIYLYGRVKNVLGGAPRRPPR